MKKKSIVTNFEGIMELDLGVLDPNPILQKNWIRIAAKNWILICLLEVYDRELLLIDI